MDCQMPELDGFEATRRFRDMESSGASPRHDRTPVVALTANAIAGDRERCLAAGMDDYVTKPIDPPAMLATIARHLSGRQPALPAKRPTAAAPPATADEVQEVVRELSGGPPLDRDALLARYLGDESLADRILAKFAARLPDDLRKLDAAIEAGDAPEVRRLAHGLKGSAANVGAEPLARAAEEIERRADGSSPIGASAREPLARLHLEADRLGAAILEPTATRA